jgi:hypothetical protein
MAVSCRGNGIVVEIDVRSMIFATQAGKDCLPVRVISTINGRWHTAFRFNRVEPEAAMAHDTCRRCPADCSREPYPGDSKWS